MAAGARGRGVPERMVGGTPAPGAGARVLRRGGGGTAGVGGSGVARVAGASVRLAGSRGRILGTGGSGERAGDRRGRSGWRPCGHGCDRLPALRPSGLDAALFVWALGAALALVRLAGGSWYVRRLARRSQGEAGDTWMPTARGGPGRLRHRPRRADGGHERAGPARDVRGDPPHRARAARRHAVERGSRAHRVAARTGAREARRLAGPGLRRKLSARSSGSTRSSGWRAHVSGEKASAPATTRC